MSQQAFNTAVDVVAAASGYTAQKVAAMTRDAQIALTAMVVVLGVVMVAQGSLAIQTYNTLEDCKRGEASSAQRNNAQIGLLVVGVLVLIGSMVAVGYLFKTRAK
jgi:hypothetical protein